MKFNFKAKTKTGETREGVIDAASARSAAEIIQRNGLFPIEIKEEDQRASIVKAILKYYDRVTEKELVVFFRQLAILIEARVPIVSSLNAVNEQTSNKYFNKVITEMVDDIEDGLPFSDALSKHKDIFSTLSINMIKSGETSGNLKKSIDYVANNIEKNYQLMSRVKGAMLYPCIVLVVFFVIGFLVISFILPRLTAMIKELGVTIPWYTHVVIVVGDFMSKYWWAVGFIILGFIGGGIYYIGTPDGRKEWDQWKIRLPIVGVIFRYVYIVRFSENLGVLLAGGIPIIRALNIVSTVINNSVYEAIFVKTAEQVRMGGNISTVLERSELIPPVVSHMIKIGEESGQIESVLGHISKFYEQETDMMTKNLSTLIEPVLMIIIGIAVGFMSVAIILPIYDVAQQIK